MNRALAALAAATVLVGFGSFGPAVGTASAASASDQFAAGPSRADCEIALDDDLALTEAAKDVDAVFVGVIDKRPTRERMTADDSTGRASASLGTDAKAVADIGWRHRVSVEDDYTGFVRAGSEITVTVTDAPGPLKPRLAKGSTYLFLASGQGNRVVASTCRVIGLPDGLSRKVADRLTQLFDPAPPTRQKPHLTLVAGAAEAPPDWGRIVAPGGALLLIGVLGLALVTRLGRERH